MLVEEVLSPAYKEIKHERSNLVKLFGKHLIWFDLSDTDNDKLFAFLRHFAAHPKTGFLTEDEQSTREEKKARKRESRRKTEKHDS